MGLDRRRLTQWMDEAASGRGGAFERLADAVQDELYRLGLANGLREADAADATQEALFRAFRDRKRWRKGGNAMAWLAAITMNVIREHRRSRFRRRHAGIDPDVLGCLGPALDDQAERLERMVTLTEAVGRLPPRQREAVTLRYLRQMSVRDTAAVMGCAEGTVKSTLSAALTHLRKDLGQDHETR